MKAIFVALLAFWLSACATPKNYSTLSRETGVPLKASIGSALYSLEKRRDMPNAFGGADVFGGKISSGYSELRFMGLADDGRIIFQFTDVKIQSNATTMNRLGSYTSTTGSTNASVYGGANYASGTSHTNVSSMTIKGTDATQIVLPPNTVRFEFDPAERTLSMEGVEVQIISVTEYQVEYLLRKGQ